MARKSKFQLPDPTNEVTCRSCGVLRPLSEFRVFKAATTGGWDGGEKYDAATSTLLMDFCVACEHAHGTLTLYRRFNAYGTKEIVDAVYQAARTPEAFRTAEQVRLLIEPKPQKAPETNEELVALEMQRRELCRRRLLYFVTTMMPSYLPSWWLQDLCRRLEKFVRDVEDGRSPRLIVAVPPRHGKSLTASDMFPSWILGKHPDWNIILASYAQELPVEFSRNIRDRINDPEYQAIFPGTKLRADAKGVEAWKTTQNGGVKAIGVGGGLTGFGGNVLIADDLIKDAEAASSDTIRQNTWNWYQMVFRSRLAPGGGILLIGTRWHWYDPTGRALELDEALKKEGVPEYERENWEVVSYPAIAEHDEYLMPDGRIEYDADPAKALRLLRRKGDALHPERYPISELKKIRNTLTKSNWSALYQQAPTPEEGDFFRRDDIQYRWLDPAYRPLCRVFMTVDYAIGRKQRNDFTVMGVHALDANDDLFTLEVRRGRWGTKDIVSNAVAMIERHKPEVYAGEQGQIHAAVWPMIQAALDEKRIYISVDETLVPIQDKEARARPLQGRTQRRKWFISYDERDRPEVYDVLEREMLQFPNGVHDDCVDMLAWAARLAMNLSLPSMKAPPKPKSWKDKLSGIAKGPRSAMAA